MKDLSPSTVLSSTLLNRIIVGIGEVANITGVSPRQIRYWEEKGIIQSVNNNSSSRKYDYSNIEKIVLIKDFLDQGYTLESAAKRLEERIQQVNKTIIQLTQNNSAPTVSEQNMPGKVITLYGQDYRVLGIADSLKENKQFLICHPLKGDSSRLIAEPIE